MRRFLWWVISLVVLCTLSTSCKDKEESESVSNQVAKIRKNKEAGEAYMRDKRLQSDVMEDPSGLLYSIVSKGEGVRPYVDDTVNITYTGKTIQDSVYVSKTETIAMSDLEDGLQIGLRHMQEGANYKLFIPYYLMYGSVSTQFSYGGKNVTVMSYSAVVYDMTLNKVIKVE
ncbi:MAG: hypothetical protein K6F48_11525 [Paludibacteraceae bacterium]|nr:hypothetical protein [Paludibacteraceae bacterium]